MRRKTKSRKIRTYLLSVFLVLAAGAAWLLYERLAATGMPGSAVLHPSPAVTGEAPLAEQDAAQPPRAIAEFRMIDLDTGWMRYEDGVVMVTHDSGESWQKAGEDWTMPEMAVAASAGGGSGEAAAETGDDQAFVTALEAIEAAHLEFESSDTIPMDGQSLKAKQVQPISGRIGWALVEDSEHGDRLLVSVDGGKTWHQEVTAGVRAAIEEEKEQRRLRAEEAALFASPEQIMKPGPHWTLFPGVTYPGDAILVRRGEPGEVEWQGKTYPLQPYKTGYYTYLPIPRSLKPGTYTIGDQELQVLKKTFKTQRLTVSEEMESMRRNTERIEADQKKVNEARSKSAPTFLFDSEFVKPLEGRLSTPYGYTRYINGKLSSTHNAIDIAAPQGTPIIATNDGVVALADELYLTGLTIYIDHGMGLFSQYAHLSELHVQTGDTVKKGDVIGLVGSTGFSTGPHLHFTFWAHNTPANPDQFFGNTPFRWTNPE